MTAIEGGINRMQQSRGGGVGIWSILLWQPKSTQLLPLSQGINNDWFPTVTYKTNVLKRGGGGVHICF